MYAIMQCAGKQYLVREGEVLKVDKLSAQDGDTVEVEQVLALGDEEGNLLVGSPYLEGAKVSLQVMEQAKDRKIIVFKYKAKKNYRRKQGHRQPYTKVKVERIQG